MPINFDDRQKQDRGPDITPLIDVVFLLLVFFLLTSSYVFKTFDLKLPAKAKVKPEAVENLPPVTVSLVKEGEILFDGISVNMQDLRRNVYAHLPVNGKRTFIVRADDEALVQLLITVMDEIRSAGATDVRIGRRPSST